MIVSGTALEKNFGGRPGGPHQYGVERKLPSVHPVRSPVSKSPLTRMFPAKTGQAKTKTQKNVMTNLLITFLGLINVGYFASQQIHGGTKTYHSVKCSEARPVPVCYQQSLLSREQRKNQYKYQCLQWLKERFRTAQNTNSVETLVLTLGLLIVLLSTHDSIAGGRYYVNTVWSHMHEAIELTMRAELIQVMKQHGFNALSVDVHWDSIRPDKSYDFSQFDSVVEDALSNGLDVFVRVNTSLTWGRKPFWLQESHLACDKTGKPFIRETDNSGIPSISNREVLRQSADFYEAVARHCRERFGSGTIVCYSAAFTLYLESEYWEQIDYSKAACSDFRWWAKREYETIEALNRKWGTSYTSWNEVNLPTAHPTAQELYFEYCLKRFFYLMKQALKRGDSKAKLGIQTGCMWDNAPGRRTANCAKFFDHCDWLFVADAPTYPHRFTCDYLRGVAQDEVCISNEIDGPYLEILTNDRILAQGVETWEQGVNTLFICNWNLGNLKDPKFTALSELGKLAEQPPKVFQSDRAIYVSVWDLIHKELGGVGPYLDFYNKLPDKERCPVDIINDGVFTRNPSVLKKYEEIYLPSNKAIPQTSREILKTVKERLRIGDVGAAGTLDEYKRNTAPLAEELGISKPNPRFR